MINKTGDHGKIVSIRLTANEYHKVKKVLDRGITIKQLLLDGVSKHEIDSVQYLNNGNDPFLGEGW